ncbi:hypothetical protein AKJ61_02370 [candidate division MSBL1 archaeon SCGC-AAA259B11]|uniref:Uncharacterized protein n=1 Tax=candidate division MSBL1 archaeon SCGC-AAA259B11 TaxID=1698260 RepID=A0A133U687_9EURY|nr:hypothetical protein AKJ61_02370 [candidate division MSBL1 archaeon SCGC-AAA259B11]
MEGWREIGLIGAFVVLLGAFLPWVQSGLWFQSGILPGFAVLGIEGVYGIVTLILAITAFGLIAVYSQDLKIRMGIAITGVLGFGIGVWNALNPYKVAEWQTSVVDFGIDTGTGLYLTMIGSLFLIGQIVVSAFVERKQ